MDNKPRVNAAVKNKELYEKLYPIAVEMRKMPTEAENVLWQALRGKKTGVKFRRQHIIDHYIVDFYCVEKALVIEVDGDIHLKQQQKDFEREKALISLGCSVLRFSNQEILSDLPRVLQIIQAALFPSP
jgi:very-short-patch-repair endonuclease